MGTFSVNEHQLELVILTLCIAMILETGPSELFLGLLIFDDTLLYSA